MNTLPTSNTGSSSTERELQELANQSPNRTSLLSLGNVMAITVKQNSEALGVYYLAAAARHLSMELVGPTRLEASASAVGRAQPTQQQVDPQLVEIYETVGYVASFVKPPLFIETTGVLPVLESLVTLHSKFLSLAHVEYLQISIFASKYNQAADIIRHTWPLVQRGINVKHVLRYYYLRGIIFMQLTDWTEAIRAYWTCLSIPCSDSAISAIAIAAWKKMVLTASILESASSLAKGGGTAATTTHLPRAMPVSLGSFFKKMRNEMQERQREDTASDDTNMHMVGNEEELQQQLTHEQPQEDQGQGSLQYQYFGVSTYMELVEIFKKEPKSVNTFVGKHEGLFRADGNLGMVRRLQQAALRRQLHHWSRIFSVISLNDLAARMAPITVSELQALLSAVAVEESWRIGMTQDENKIVVVHFGKLPVRTTDTAKVKEELERVTKLVQSVDLTSKASTTTVANKSAGDDTIMFGGPHGVEDF